jgi:tRNA C32,U32 (ribose-2'-O)-methylase TrmJ
MLQGKLPTGMGLAVEDVEELRKSMHEVISAWWTDEPEDLREDLRDALQISRGIPQEVDRQLLLRMRQRLARALSLPEKKMLREILRQVVTEPAAPALVVGDGLPPDLAD